MKVPRFSPRVIVHRSAAAQSMVEFALVAMVLFLMLFGIFEISRLVFTINSVNNGAREGAHWAAINTNQVQNCTASGCPASTIISVTNQIAPMLFLIDTNNSSNFSLSVSCPTCSTCLPTSNPPCYYPPVTVRLTNTLQLAVPFPGLGSSVVITGASTSQVER